MKTVIKNNVVPIGTYPVEFTGLEEVASEMYGDGWRWDFTILAGEYSDRVVSRFTGNSPSPKNAAGKFLAALAGQTPRDGMEIDPDDYIGHRYNAMLAATASGGTRVEVITPAAPAPSASGADVPF